MRLLACFCFCLFAIIAARPAAADANGRARFLASLDHPALIMFYSGECPPCHAEINALPDLAQAAQGRPIVIALLTKADEKLKDAAAGANIKLIDVSQHGATLLQAFNHNRLALPFAFATDAGGKICAAHTGLLGTARVAAWRRRCLT